ncbi:MAG: OmpA family protein [Pseudomonadota bacterium]
MRPGGFGSIASVVFARQAGVCAVALAGFALIGVTASAGLNAVAPQPATSLSVKAPKVTDIALISAPQPLAMPAPDVQTPAPIAAPAAPAPKQPPAPAPQQVTVIAVTPTITQPSIESCVTQLAAFVEGKSLHFPTASAALTPDETEVLKLIGTQAQACPEALVQIEGHTDSVGPDALNLKLSWKRAENTLAALKALGIETRQFEPVGYGARAPLAQGDASEDHLNRRVAFTVLKRPEPGT